MVTVDREAPSRPIQERTSVSVRLVIGETLHTSLSLPKWKISYGKYLEGLYHIPGPQSLHVCNLHGWVSFDGASPRLGSTLQLLVLVGLCIPRPHQINHCRRSQCLQSYVPSSTMIVARWTRCKGKIDKGGETYPICKGISNDMIGLWLCDCFTLGRHCGEDANFSRSPSGLVTRGLKIQFQLSPTRG